MLDSIPYYYLYDIQRCAGFMLNLTCRKHGASNRECCSTMIMLPTKFANIANHENISDQTTMPKDEYKGVRKYRTHRNLLISYGKNVTKNSSVKQYCALQFYFA